MMIQYSFTDENVAESNESFEKMTNEVLLVIQPMDADYKFRIV